MRVLIIATQFLSQASFGILSLADSLMQSGHEVRLMGAFSDSQNAMSVFFQNNNMREAFVKEIEEFEPEFIGISSMSHGAHHIPWLSTFLKHRFPNVPILHGGQNALVMKEKVLEITADVDYVMYGESEESLPKFLGKLQAGDTDYSDVDGLIYRSENEIVKNPLPRAVDINKYFPARAVKCISKFWANYNANHLKTDKLKKPQVMKWHSPIALPYFEVLLTRGCPYRCTFCKTNSEWDSHYPIRNVDPKVFEEQLDYIIKEFHVKSLFIYDSAFNLNKKWAREICAILKRREEIVDWFCQLRPNLVDEEICQLLVESRCRGVNLYAESGMDAIRNGVFNKQVSDEQLHNAFRLTKQYGLFRRCNIIVGVPGETIDSIKQSYRIVNNLEPDSFQVSPLDAYIDTELYEKHKDKVIYDDIMVYDEETNKLKKAKAFKGYIKVELPRALILGLTEAMNIFGHYFSILMRRTLKLQDKSFMIVEPDKEQERFMIDFFRGISPVQVMAWGLWLQDILEPKEEVLMLTGPDTKVNQSMLPEKVKLKRMGQAPLDMSAADSEWQVVSEKKIDTLIVPYYRAKQETLEKVIRIASYISVKQIYFVDMYKGSITEWDMLTKLAVNYHYQSDIEQFLVDLNEMETENGKLKNASEVGSYAFY